MLRERAKWVSGHAPPCTSVLAYFIVTLLAWTHSPMVASANGGERVPRILEHPQSLVVPRRGPATLNCAAEGSPSPKITWFRDGVVVTTSPEDPRSHKVILPSGSLFFLSIKQGKKESDAGVYNCVASNVNGRVSSNNATLTIAMLREEFKTVPQDVAAASGERAEILCVPPKGHPPPKLSWTRNGQPIDLKEEGERVQLREDGTLVIKEVLQTDEGEYVCHATNPAGERSSPPAILDVIAAPRVVEVPGDVEVEEGAALLLVCAVQGFPVPLVYWTREGSQTILPASRTPMAPTVGGVEGEEQEGLEGVKLTYSVSRAARHNSGRYVCGGVNSAGGVMTRVGVRVRPAHLLPPPIISVAPTNQTLPIRGHAAMTCRVWGSPLPTVTWRHNGRLVTSTHRRSLLPDNTLTIDELAAEDGGQYACVASSTRGVTEARATLTVASATDPDVVFIRAPDPDTAPRPPATPTVRSNNGTAAVVEWSPPGRQGASPVTGYTLEYYSNSGAAWTVAAAHLRRTSFTLTPLDPARTYGVAVRAHNAHGVSEPSGIAEVGVGGGWVRGDEEDQGLQEARVVLQDAAPTGQASAKILWQMTGEGSSVEGFYIRLHHTSRDFHPSPARVTAAGAKPRVKGAQRPPLGEPGNSTVVTVLNAGPGASSYVLHGLYHYRAYTVFLVPFFKTYEGHPSNSRSFETPEAAPTMPPQSVGVQLTNVTTAAVFWSPPPPLHRNGPIVGYQLEIVSADGSVFLSKAVNGSVTSLRVHNLTLGNSYHLTLASSTTAGRGPYTSPVSLHVDPVLLHPLAKVGLSLSTVTEYALALTPQ
ncbi:roundabout homolog 2-like [Panulirus ornatus]|uniref:roundabout homolog 2-like n=1 Tax=Panulirus ornatus TaxID=150431 RepID=UPI003A8B723B